MAAIEVFFDPVSGRVTDIAHGSPLDPWKILSDEGGVSILGKTDRSKVGLIGSGRWTGEGIADRYAPDGLIDAKIWDQLERVLQHVHAARTPLPAAVAEPAVTGYHELIVDLTTGVVVFQARMASDRRPASAFEWMIVVEDDRVLVHAHDERMFARATWNGSALSDHEVRAGSERAINDYQWGVVQKAVVEVLTGVSAPMPYNQYGAPAPAPSAKPAKVKRSKAARGISSARSDAPPPMSPTSATSATSTTSATSATSATTPDRRSGWWAFAATAVALGATLVSWRTMPRNDNIAWGVTIALATITTGLLSYTIYGVKTACPGCSAWYRRETTSTTETGSSTYSKQISKDVTDSSGKKIGSTTETATYERTSYLYYYRCKHCSHTWTGTGSSERRIR